MVTKTSAQAQNQFGKLLDLAQHERIAITRHGRPTAFVVSAREIEEIDQMREKWRKTVAADWEAWRQMARESMTQAAEALTDEDVVRMVHEEREKIRKAAHESR